MSAREQLGAERFGDDDVNSSTRTRGLIGIVQVLHADEGWLACASGEDDVALRVEAVQLDRRVVVHNVNVATSASSFR